MRKLSKEEERFLYRFDEGKSLLDAKLKEYREKESKLRAELVAISEEYGISFELDYGGYVPDSALPDFVGEELFEEELSEGEPPYRYRGGFDHAKWIEECNRVREENMKKLPQEIQDWLKKGGYLPGCCDGYSANDEPGWWMPSAIC